MIRNIVFALWVGGALVGTMARADEPTERWWIRLVEGREILAIGDVLREHGLVLYRTPAGVLSSIPDDRVDVIERVLLPEGSTASAGDDQPDRAPEEVPTFTNDDLPTEPLPWQASFTRAAGSPADGVPDVDAEERVDIPLTYDSYLDRNGNDERWWRELAAEIDADRDDAREGLEIWTQRHRELSDLVALECVGRRHARYLPAVCAEYVRLQRDASERVAKARAWLDEVEAERGNLSDEARRADALPGWLR